MFCGAQGRVEEGFVGRILLLVALALFLLGASSPTSDFLCPEQAKLPKDQDDSRMHEREFTLDHAIESLEFLQNDFSSRIFSPGPKELRNDSSNYISYANSLKIIEGALLKQQALLERSRRDTLSARAASRSSQSDAGVRFAAAKKRFCEFVQSAEYVD